jgi:hypothetical protein
MAHQPLPARRQAMAAHHLYGCAKAMLVSDDTRTSQAVRSTILQAPACRGQMTDISDRIVKTGYQWLPVFQVIHSGCVENISYIVQPCEKKKAIININDLVSFASFCLTRMFVQE